jgi:hypothetical protein
LCEHLPVILVALHGEEQAEFCLQFLKDSGYKVHHLKDQTTKQNLLFDEIYAVPA